MKHTSIPLLIVLIFCLSCNNTTDSKTESTSKENNVTSTESASEAASISFKVNDVSVNTQPLGITRSLTGNMAMINIITDRDKNPQTLNITINGNKTGVYQFVDGFQGMKTEGSSFGSYTPDAKNDALNVYSLIDGSIELLSIDTSGNKLSTKFSGTAKNVKGEEVKITDGKITNASINPGVIK